MANYTVGTGGISLPDTTAPNATGTAMGLGQQVYNKLPGYNQSVANIGGNIQNETAGILPADVTRQIEQTAAERGVATGTGGSQNNNAAMLQALGLTSLNLTNLGEQNLNAELPNLPGAQISQNPAFYSTPQQYLSATGQAAQFGNQEQQQRQAQSNQERGLQLARQGLSAGAAGAGVGSFTIPGDNSAAADAAWWNQPDYAPTTWQGPGATASPTDKILQNYNATVTGAGQPGGSAWNPAGNAEGGGTGDIDPLTGQSYANFEEAA